LRFPARSRPQKETAGGKRETDGFEHAPLHVRLVRVVREGRILLAAGLDLALEQRAEGVEVRRSVLEACARGVVHLDVKRRLEAVVGETFGAAFAGAGAAERAEGSLEDLLGGVEAAREVEQMPHGDAALEGVVLPLGDGVAGEFVPGEEPILDGRGGDDARETLGAAGQGVGAVVLPLAVVAFEDGHAVEQDERGPAAHACRVVGRTLVTRRIGCGRDRVGLASPRQGRGGEHREAEQGDADGVWCHGGGRQSMASDGLQEPTEEIGATP
jgi:hypothetical protein